MKRNTIKLESFKEPRVDVPMVRSFLKSIQEMENSPGGQYAISGHLLVLEKQESLKIRTRQNLEIALRKAQAEIEYLKTQPDWQPFFEQAAASDSENQSV